MESQTFTSAQKRSEFTDLLEQSKRSLGENSLMDHELTRYCKWQAKRCWKWQRFENKERLQSVRQVDQIGSGVSWVWTRAKMKIRAMQIWGFLLAVLGWIFVSCTMAMEGWKISSIGGQGGSSIMSVGWYWSSLWRACFTDSASTSNCYDFPVLWSVEGMDIIKVFESTYTMLLIVRMRKRDQIN